MLVVPSLKTMDPPRLATLSFTLQPSDPIIEDRDTRNKGTGTPRSEWLVNGWSMAG